MSVDYRIRLIIWKTEQNFLSLPSLYGLKLHTSTVTCQICYAISSNVSLHILDCVLGAGSFQIVIWQPKIKCAFSKWSEYFTKLLFYNLNRLWIAFIISSDSRIETAGQSFYWAACIKAFWCNPPVHGRQQLGKDWKVISLICQHIPQSSSSDQIETHQIDLVNDQQFTELLLHFALAKRIP